MNDVKNLCSKYSSAFIPVGYAIGGVLAGKTTAIMALYSIIPLIAHEKWRYDSSSSNQLKVFLERGAIFVASTISYKALWHLFLPSSSHNFPRQKAGTLLAYGGLLCGVRFLMEYNSSKNLSQQCESDEDRDEATGVSSPEGSPSVQRPAEALPQQDEAVEERDEAADVSSPSEGSPSAKRGEKPAEALLQSEQAPHPKGGKKGSRKRGG